MGSVGSYIYRQGSSVTPNLRVTVAVGRSEAFHACSSAGSRRTKAASIARANLRVTVAVGRSEAFQKQLFARARHREEQAAEVTERRKMVQAAVMQRKHAVALRMERRRSLREAAEHAATEQRKQQLQAQPYMLMVEMCSRMQCMKVLLPVVRKHSESIQRFVLCFTRCVCLQTVRVNNWIDSFRRSSPRGSITNRTRASDPDFASWPGSLPIALLLLSCPTECR